MQLSKVADKLAGTSHSNLDSRVDSLVLQHILASEERVYELMKTLVI